MKHVLGSMTCFASQHLFHDNQAHFHMQLLANNNAEKKILITVTQNYFIYIVSQVYIMVEFVILYLVYRYIYIYDYNNNNNKNVQTGWFNFCITVMRILAGHLSWQ